MALASNDVQVGALGRFSAALAERVLGRPVPGLAERVEQLAAPTAPGPRRPDGTRAATLTAAGIPMEASVTGRGELEPMVRVAVEPGTAIPFFGPRLAALKMAADTLAGELALDAAVAAEVRALVPTAHPDPAAVPARTPGLAGSVGVVHHAAVDGLAGIKVYAHLRPDPRAHTRVVNRWPELGSLLEPHDDRWERHAVAFDADIRGRLTKKAYVRSTHPLAADDLAAAVDRAVPGSAWVLEHMDKAGAAGRVGRRTVYLCRTVVGAGEPPVATLYWGIHGAPWARDRDAVLRALASDFHGTDSGVDALVAAGAAGGTEWTYTIVGVGLVPEGGTPKLNLYGCPSAL